MGLTTFKGKKPTNQEIGVAKNYLAEEEFKITLESTLKD